jgi:hypothetical protein
MSGTGLAEASHARDVRIGKHRNIWCRVLNNSLGASSTMLSRTSFEDKLDAIWVGRVTTWPLRGERGQLVVPVRGLRDSLRGTHLHAGESWASRST